MTIELSGKWQNISRTVRSLERREWHIVTVTGNENFTLTICVMTNEYNDETERRA